MKNHYIPAIYFTADFSIIPPLYPPLFYNIILHYIRVQIVIEIYRTIYYTIKLPVTLLPIEIVLYVFVLRLGFEFY